MFQNQLALSWLMLRLVVFSFALVVAGALA